MNGSGRANTLFRIGPVSLIPVMLAWAVICNVLHSQEDQSWYYIYPAYIALVVALVWFVALIVLARDNRLAYLFYALVFVPIFYFIDFLAVAFATRFPL
jgi:hypothetical protein